MLTADQVRSVTFSRARGPGASDEGTVDRFLARVAATLDALERGRTIDPSGQPLLLPDDVRRLELPPSTGRTGYTTADVESLQAAVARTLDEYVRRFAGEAAPTSPASSAMSAMSAAPVSTGAGTPVPPPLDLTGAPDGLSAYDVSVAVQSARATLFGPARDHLLTQGPDGTLRTVADVTPVQDGIVVHLH